jgi:hypothetical protein
VVRGNMTKEGKVAAQYGEAAAYYVTGTTLMFY